jgi:hypothetical protein
LSRLYLVCSRATCRDATCPLDARLGFEEYATEYARRLLCRAGSSWSFAPAQDQLREFCGIKVSAELIRRIMQREAVRMEKWQATASAAAAFVQAEGDIEFETDATKVNTTEGFRDVKIGIYAKRPRGESATPETWATRSLPTPTARFAFAAIEESRTFAERWGTTAEQLGVDRASAALTVLADGAEWIWNRTAEQFPKATGVLDIYHAAEHIADAAKQYLGEGEATRTQAAHGRDRLLADGYLGLEAWLGALHQGPPAAGGDGAALGAMMNYFAGHRNRLNYVLRLKRGQSIGSGMVEGAAKNMIGRRLKANLARWLPANVNRMGVVCATLYSGNWEAYWNGEQ